MAEETSPVAPAAPAGPQSTGDITSRMEEKIFSFGDLDIAPDKPAAEEDSDDGEEMQADASEEGDADDAEETDTDDEGDASEEGEEGSIDIEYNGKIYAVPPELKEAFMRQDDYTRKTQEVAAARKQADVQVGELKMAAEQYAFAQSVWDQVQQAQQLDLQASEWQKYMRENLDALTSTDIEKIRFKLDEFKQQRDALVQDVTNKQRAFQQSQQQTRQELLKKGTEALRTWMPNWGQTHIREALDEAVRSDFTEAEIAEVLDPRYVRVLWKAAQWEKLQAKKGAAVSKVQGAPQIKAKARNPMPDKVKAKLSLRKALKSESRTSAEKAKVIQKAMEDRLGDI